MQNAKRTQQLYALNSLTLPNLHYSYLCRLNREKKTENISFKNKKLKASWQKFKE